MYFNVVSECRFAHPRMDRGTDNFYVNAVGNKRVAQVNLALDQNLKAWKQMNKTVLHALFLRKTFPPISIAHHAAKRQANEKQGGVSITWQKRGLQTASTTQLNPGTVR